MHEHTPTIAHRAPDERGFGLVEVLVVLLILGIVLAVAVPSISGGRDNASVVQARSVARSLGEGIEQFQRDHGGRLPTAPGTADWGDAWQSPVDRANGGKAYARAGSVEALTTGAAALETASGAVAPDARPDSTRIRYVVDDAAGFYGLVVRSRRGDAWKVECHVTNATTTGSGARFIDRLGTRKRC